MATNRWAMASVLGATGKCGLTPQYEGLEALHEELGPKKVLGL